MSTSQSLTTKVLQVISVAGSFPDLGQVRTFLGTVTEVTKNPRCLRYFHSRPVSSISFKIRRKVKEVEEIRVVEGLGHLALGGAFGGHRPTGQLPAQSGTGTDPSSIRCKGAACLVTHSPQSNEYIVSII